MTYLILDEAITQVKSAKSREYLKEVLSSFNIGNYRSAIVVLYSIVIFDIIEKLTVSSEYYSDEKSKKLLNEINKIKNDPSKKFSDWENHLLNNITSTNLINSIEKIKLINLKNNRNMYAHSFYNDNYSLIYPSKETARALIRDAFEITFLKDALLVNEILIPFLNDANEYFQRNEENGFEEYLKNKYFKRLGIKEKNYIFRETWKFAFKTDNEACDLRRTSNTLVLHYLMKENENHFLKLIEDDQDFYSELEVSKDEIEYGCLYSIFSKTSALIYFLTNHFKIFYKLNLSAQALLKAEIEKNFYYTFRSPFISENLDIHIKQIAINFQNLPTSKYPTFYELELKHNMIKEADFKCLYNFGISKGEPDIFFDFLIDYLSDSPQFSSADHSFSILEAYYPELSKEQFHKLISICDKNNQIYGSSRFIQNFERIKVINDEITENRYDYTQHNNILSKINLTIS